MKHKPVFIEARFELPEPARKEVAKLLKVTDERAAEATVSKDFDGRFYVGFHKAGSGPITSKKVLIADLDSASGDLGNAKLQSGEDVLRDRMLRAIENASGLLATKEEDVDASVLETIEEVLNEVDVSQAHTHSTIAARFGQLVSALTGMSTEAPEADRQAARNLVVKNLPSFVYYSNYGNLDSEIYLPHVIENMKRHDLGAKEQAKARTLRVLFDFVKLSPDEIREMGQDINLPPGTPPTAAQQAQIEAVAAKKKERDILLQSASTALTRKFRDWWKQGDYRFRFAADGNHFRIWVSDDKRPEDIELEARSTGLQWFFSFYLVFLVESEDSHEGAILLLDEPGLSLHPLAQRDLSNFFEGLADTNQLIYTAHSPFMVDPDHLDRAKAVYVNDQGVTQVSADLRAPEGKTDRAKSVYAAYAALRMSVSDTLLLGCQPVVAEGPSDQHYFSAIKNYLIGKGVLTPRRDILFMPSGGARGTRAVCSLVMGRDDQLPFAVLDADEAGRKFAAGLKSGLYQGAKERVLSIGDFISLNNAEAEDLFPPTFIAKIVDRYLPKPIGVDEDFTDVVRSGEPMVPQVERYAAKHGIHLEDSWKVEVATRVKAALLHGKEEIEDQYLAVWKKLFGTLHLE